MLRTMVCSLHRATRILEQDVGNDRCWLNVGARVVSSYVVLLRNETDLSWLKGFAKTDCNYHIFYHEA